MPKMKTHSASKKRFKLTGTGKIRRNKACKSHLLNSSSKSAKRKRGLRKSTIVSKANEAVIRVLIQNRR